MTVFLPDSSLKKTSSLMRRSWLLVLCSLWWAQTAPADSLQVQQQLSAYLTNAASSLGLNHPDSLSRFYADHGYQPVWIIQKQLTHSAHQLLQVLAHAEQHGLNPEDYQAETLLQQALQLNQTPSATAESIHRQVLLELLISDSLLQFARHLYAGRVSPRWELPAKTVALDTLLPALVSAEQPTQQLLAWAPRHRGYHALQKQLVILQTQTQWPNIDIGPTLRIGDQGKRVKQLRARMGLSAEPGLFTTELKQHIMAFQEQHGLNPDGAAGKNTLEVLNTPLTERIQQIKANMERWRWLPDVLGTRYIMVNIPEFNLRYVEHDQERLGMAVIVGQQKRATPLFAGNMTYLVFNPSWYVPRSIAVKDKLPKLIQDPGYLDRHNMQVFTGQGRDRRQVNPYAVPWHRFNEHSFPFRLVQNPGPGNALGKVKFMFPNRHNVYLHDTSQPHLFTKTTRTFSSGCIRVAQPKALAEVILSQPGEHIQALFAQQNKKTITLKAPIPVYLVYFTAWQDPNQQLHFTSDIYQHDAELIKALHIQKTNLPKLQMAHPEHTHSAAS
ncbi:MAG: L,D-transpeptidase family protein [Methylococcales bacterium]|nr:L,D-transpeptidase family protein [Methylococcales bacterium]